MLQVHVKQQDSFSRIQLLTRTLFGAIYIFIPHLFILLFVMIWAKILWIYATFHILINGTYPRNAWDFQIGLMNWLSRVHLSAYNLVDGYPVFGISKETDYLTVDAPYNETPDRLWVLIRFFFAGLMILPHVFIWTFRNLWSGILSFLAFWVVLFTGKYPSNWFEFNIGTLRWVMRIMAYQLYIFEDYPPFTGREE